MKIVPFDEIRHNRYFWLYFLSVCFPLAMDEEENIALADYIYENYDCTHEAAEWTDKFVLFSEEIMQERGGYAENPTAVQFRIDSEVFTVQFHPGNTVFFRGTKMVGSTGGNYQVHKLIFEGFRFYAAQLADPGIAVLLLPLVAVSEEQTDAARELIGRLLADAPFPQEERDVFAEMILTGLLE